MQIFFENISCNRVDFTKARLDPLLAIIAYTWIRLAGGGKKGRAFVAEFGKVVEVLRQFGL
jgi:hypothetical protein